jgi:hypothetical protein
MVGLLIKNHEGLANCRGLSLNSGLLAVQHREGYLRFTSYQTPMQSAAALGLICQIVI